MSRRKAALGAVVGSLILGPAGLLIGGAIGANSTSDDEKTNQRSHRTYSYSTPSRSSDDDYEQRRIEQEQEREREREREEKERLQKERKQKEEALNKAKNANSASELLEVLGEINCYDNYVALEVIINHKCADTNILFNILKQAISDNTNFNAYFIILNKVINAIVEKENTVSADLIHKILTNIKGNGEDLEKYRREYSLIFAQLLKNKSKDTITRFAQLANYEIERRFIVHAIDHTEEYQNDDFILNLLRLNPKLRSVSRLYTFLSTESILNLITSSKNSSEIYAIAQSISLSQYNLYHAILENSYTGIDTLKLLIERIQKYHSTDGLKDHLAQILNHPNTNSDILSLLISKDLKEPEIMEILRHSKADFSVVKRLKSRNIASTGYIINQVFSYSAALADVKCHIHKIFSTYISKNRAKPDSNNKTTLSKYNFAQELIEKILSPKCDSFAKCIKILRDFNGKNKAIAKSTFNNQGEFGKSIQESFGFIKKLADQIEKRCILPGTTEFLLEIEMALVSPSPTADDWNNLGAKYHKFDTTKALKCYENALNLDLNHPQANYNMGRLFRYGMGVDENLTEAQNYFSISAVNGCKKGELDFIEVETVGQNINDFSAECWNNKGEMYQKNSDCKKAFICYRKALDLNPSEYDATCNLANLYHTGNGVDKNLLAAKKLYQRVKPSAQNYQTACKKLTEINNEILSQIKKLLPLLFENQGIEDAQKDLCIANKKIIVDCILEEYRNDIEKLKYAISPENELGKILSTHRDQPGLKNLWHRADTATINTIKSRIRILEKNNHNSMLKPANFACVKKIPLFF